MNNNKSNKALIELGNLEKINDLRLIWKNEAYDFTPWLAEEDNMSILGDTIGIEISEITTESAVGGFSADISTQLDWRELPERKASRILIENEVDLKNETKWEEQFDWMMNLGIKFYHAFKSIE